MVAAVASCAACPALLSSRTMSSMTKHTIAELTALVKTRLKRMQYRPGLLVGFLVSSGLQFGPFL